MTIDTPEDISTHFQNPPLVCDVVMKGGITSGVVYPPAILKLATAYRFRCIGGTSAGAIAAAVAAAAEYNREGGGFEKLCKIQQTLSKKNFVRDLFQPFSNSRPVMETLLAIAGEKSKEPEAEAQAGSRQQLKNKPWFLLPLWVRQLLRLHESLLLKDLKVVVAGALVGIGLPFGWAWLIGGSLDRTRLIIPLFTGWLGALLAGVFHLSWILFNKVPTEESFYGMCIGHKQDDESSNRPEVLTDWLSNTINDVAGKPYWLIGNDGKRRGNPLTFADLANKKYGGEGITLQLVTTNLSQSEPYIFPREQMNLIFKEEEMKKFFPDFVVDYMVRIAKQPGKRNGPEQPEDAQARSFAALEQAAKFEVAQQERSQSSGINLPPGYYFLPAWHDLPVIVATRMSLSFPILLCAVPLYTIASAATEKAMAGSLLEEKFDLQKNWFSDGGICSNFPIHFFDTWLPRCPTFGINLTSLPKQKRNKKRFQREQKRDQQELIPCSMASLSHDASRVANLNQRIFLPKAKDEVDPQYGEIQGLFGFIGAIIETMQNYRDNTQARLPSYRERIVQIRFDNEREGGLNLAMNSATIQSIGNMGEQAAQKLVPGGEFDFNEHMWVRLRVVMTQLEKHLEALEKGYPNISTYEQLLEEQLKRLNDEKAQFYCDEDEE